MNQYDLKFIADAECELYIDGEYITQLKRGGIYKTSQSEGEYIIQAKTKNPKIRIKDINNFIIYTSELSLKVKLTNKFNKEVYHFRVISLFFV